MKINFAYFTKAERRGALVFLGFVVSISLGQQLWQQYSHKTRNTSTKNEKIKTILQEEGIVALATKPKDNAPLLSPKAINPNTATLEELQAIGMTTYAAKSLIGYRAYRPIYSDQDILKVFGMDSTSLATISPWINYDTKPSASKKYKPNPKHIKLSTTPLNPNTASQQELEDIGFSRFSASNIVKFRNSSDKSRLENIEDVKKIYGVDKATLNQVTPLLLFDPKPSSDEVIPIKEKSNNQREDKSKTDTKQTNFNPNTANYQELTAQGIPGKVANTIIKFRRGETTFGTPEDLLKVYDFTPVLLDSIRSNIEIPDKAAALDSISITEMTKVDLTTTTPEQLVLLDGIGPYFSEAICKYRDALGGFHSVEQLKEVPAMKAEIYEHIKSRFIISGKIIKFVPISMEFKEALKHPYMDYESTKLLFNLSANNYNKELDQLIKKGMVDTRLIPYLLVD